MSTDCENLLKKFLILNPSKRGSLEVRPRREEVGEGRDPPKLKASSASSRS